MRLQGFRFGQFRMPEGKWNAYDNDLRVPFVVRGPGVPPRGHTAPCDGQHTALHAQRSVQPEKRNLERNRSRPLLHRITPAAHITTFSVAVRRLECVALCSNLTITASDSHHSPRGHTGAAQHVDRYPRVERRPHANRPRPRGCAHPIHDGRPVRRSRARHRPCEVRVHLHMRACACVRLFVLLLSFAIVSAQRAGADAPAAACGARGAAERREMADGAADRVLWAGRRGAVRANTASRYL